MKEVVEGWLSVVKLDEASSSTGGAGYGLCSGDRSPDLRRPGRFAERSSTSTRTWMSPAAPVVGEQVLASSPTADVVGGA